MANFVEQATLAVKNASSSQIKQINKDLRALYATAKLLRSRTIDVKTKASGVAQTTRQLSRAAKEADRLRGKPINVKVSATGIENIERRLTRLTRRRSIPIEIGKDLARDAGRSVEQFSRRAIVGGARATGNEVLTEDSARARVLADSRFNSNPELMSQIDELVTEMSQRFKGSSRGQLMALVPEAASQADDFETIAESLERMARNASMFGQAANDMRRGAENARQIEKGLQIRGVTSDPAVAQKFSDALFSSVLISGGDITGSEVKRMLQQVGGAKNTLTPEGMAMLVTIRDEGGRRSTSEVRSFIQDLTRSNLNEKSTEQQIKAGLRDKKGFSTIEGKLLADPVAAVMEEIIPRLLKRGVNLDDDAALNQGLNALGLLSTSQRFAQMVIKQRDEQTRTRARLSNIDGQTFIDNPTLLARMKGLNDAFVSVGAQVAETAVPALEATMASFTESLNNVRNGDGGVTDYASLIGSGSALGVGAIASSLIDPMTRPLGISAVALTGSATALTGAATALTGAAAAQTVFGRDGAPTPGGGKVKKVAGAVVGAGIVAAAVDSVHETLTNPQHAKNQAAPFMEVLPDFMRSGIRAFDKFTGLDSLVTPQADRGAQDPTVVAQKQITDAERERVDELVQQISILDATIAEQQKQINRRENDPTRDLPTKGLEDAKAAAVVERGLLMQEKDALMGQLGAWQSAFEASTVEATASVSQGLQQGGILAAESLVSQAPSVGDTIGASMAAHADAIGASIAAHISNATVNVAAPTPRPDTGSQQPN